MTQSIQYNGSFQRKPSTFKVNWYIKPHTSAIRIVTPAFIASTVLHFYLRILILTTFVKREYCCTLSTDLMMDLIEQFCRSSLGQKICDSNLAPVG